MKRLVLVLCLCGLLAVPSTAMAGVFAPDNQFQGRAEGDPNTYFGFDVTGKKKHRKVRHLAVAVPMACYDGTQGIVEVPVPGSFRLRSPGVVLVTVSGGSSAHEKARPHHRHHVKIFFAESDVDTPNGSGEIYLFGEVGRHGKARGYLQVHTDGASTGKCYSGLLEWKAKRGVDVTYPPVE
jgi:hypothetical protein